MSQTTTSQPHAGVLPTPQAPRLRPPSWRDPRLLVGVVLVLASVALGSRVVAAADDTVPVYAAAQALVPGDPLTSARVVVVQARVDGETAAYLSAAEPLPGDAVVLRPVGPGELVPRGAVGAADELEHRPVGIPVAGSLAGGVVKGALVDVWVSRPDPERAGGFLEPTRLAAAAQVAEVATGGSAFTTGGSTTVQVLLTEDEVGSALWALAAGAEVALVLVPGSTPGGG